jgi:hypothetical protein
MPQHDDDAVFNGEVENCIFKLLDPFRGMQLFFQAISFRDIFIAEQVTPFLLFQKIEGSVNGNSVQPAEEPVSIVIRIELFICLDESRLRYIGGVSGVRENSQGDVEDRLLIAGEDCFKRLEVTGQASPDEIFVVWLLHKYSWDGKKLVLFYLKDEIKSSDFENLADMARNVLQSELLPLVTEALLGRHQHT